MNDQIDVLIPTCNRPGALAVTLAALIGQSHPSFRVVISDQSDGTASYDAPEAVAAIRVLRLQGRDVKTLRNLPRRGLAHQRQTLLDHARAPMALFLDDDVILEADMLERMSRALHEARCGFIGCAVLGASYAHDVRPHQQAVEFWNEPVKPEHITPGDEQWRRHLLHNAANLWHVQRALGVTAEAPRLYKVAWVGGCVLYDTAKLRDAGAFSFWRDLPPSHCGEDVLAQLRVMARDGGAGLMPSGAWHQELPTTVTERDVDAPFALDASRLPLAIAPGRVRAQIGSEVTP
ncbi:MAG TPA: glycosyltransferase family A protein [Burkholderiaceae bacterium]|nr:glycosyltransferase family A protein [Burkholderiaceae bacterium]